MIPSCTILRIVSDMFCGRLSFIMLLHKHVSHHTSLLLILFFILTGFNGQPCMTLQMKFFRLVSIDSSGMSISSPSDVAVEIDAYTYQSGKIGPSPDMFVSAQEVVFDSLGKVTCNRSMCVFSVLSHIMKCLLLISLYLYSPNFLSSFVYECY